MLGGFALAVMAFVLALAGLLAGGTAHTLYTYGRDEWDSYMVIPILLFSLIALSFGAMGYGLVLRREWFGLLPLRWVCWLS